MYPAYEAAHWTALVAYGSETGNAADYAAELGRMIERLHFKTSVHSLESIYPSVMIAHSFVILVTSTTGQGDLPANSQRFWRALLKKNLPADCLSKVIFTTFGLGDSSYPRFNWATRKLHKRLLQLGASELCDRGEADEQHDEGSDAAFVPWSTNLRQTILNTFPLPPGLNPLPIDALLPPIWTLKASALPNPQNNGSALDSNTSVVAPKFEIELTENRRLTPAEHWQDVRHMTFSSNVRADYYPGDVLTIYPENQEVDVDHILDLMEWRAVADTHVQLRPTKPDDGWEELSQPPIKAASQLPLKFRDLIRKHLDITAVPRRSFFSLIAHFTDDSDQKERLLEFTKPEHIDELFDYTTRPRRSILEVLQEFHTVKIPWQWAANVFPLLRGRQFSIASGGRLKKNLDGTARFELLVAIVRYKTVIKKIREGVCTKYLAALNPGALLAVTLEKGSFGPRKAADPKPLILIGPGTGVAPLRAILWERAQHFQEGRDESGTGIGNSLLVFGCRNASADFFYQHEWDAVQSHIPLDVCAAFSRDQKQKVYVQDIVRQQKDTICTLLRDQGGSIFVCGSSGKMPTAVRAALADALREAGHTSQVDADAYLAKIENEGRYTQETWS